jgi:BCD family chlorophyll transporter-like MFS transporter
MSRLDDIAVRQWQRLGPRLLPFADAASEQLPLSRLLRLSLFMISVGMTMVLLAGTLNRVMIVELGVPASIVAVMLALPVLFAPMRALVGFRSDVHKSAIGWRRVPYMWMGTMLQFSGLAIMPFALILLSDESPNRTAGVLGAALAFLITGAGIHTVQTAGLALASDLSPADKRPRVFAFLYVALLAGMIVSALAFGLALAGFTNTRLAQVIQTVASLVMIFNVLAMWKQEPRRPELTTGNPDASFSREWRVFAAVPGSVRLLAATTLGTAGFSMQDVLLEPYGGSLLGMTVSQTTLLTALTAGGALGGFVLAGTALTRGMNACRLAALGALAGVPALVAISLAGAFGEPWLLRAGAVLIGFGGGLFTIGTLTAAVRLPTTLHDGLAVGAWGAAQATAAGVGLGLGGAIKDAFADLAASGVLGAALQSPWASYGVVYQIEILLLFVTLAVIGPLARYGSEERSRDSSFGFAEFPG